LAIRPRGFPPMPYFFARRQGDLVEITGADARHLARSLRARPGERVSVVEPAGRLLTVRLESVGPAVAVGRVEAEVEPRPPARRSGRWRTARRSSSAARAAGRRPGSPWPATASAASARATCAPTPRRWRAWSWGWVRQTINPDDQTPGNWSTPP